MRNSFNELNTQPNFFKSRALLDKVLSPVSYHQSDCLTRVSAFPRMLATMANKLIAFNMLGPKQTAKFNDFIVDIVFLIMCLD